jgi:MFS family permease
VGYADPALLIALVAGLGSAIGFVRLERRIEDPLIDLSIFREPALRRGLGSGLVAYMVLFGTLFVVAPAAGRLLNRVGERPLTTGGLILTGLGLLGIVLWRSTPGLLAGIAFVGIGLGAFTPANNATIMAASPPGYTGVIGGVLNMTRGMGTALGVAFAGALYIAASAASGVNIADADRAAAAHGLIITMAIFALAALATGVATPFGKRRRGTAGKGQA